jgi:eukaryotic-like serine/threonine-protein kinase
MSEDHRLSRVGQVVGQRYRLIAELGSGGQGTVYRGIDLKHGDEVAVKVIEPDVLNEQWRERTFREAHALTVLTGTAAVRVLHQVWADDGAFCLIMELLRGSDLDKFLRDRETLNLRQELAQLLPLILPVVETLEFAHNAGILHRDLKPGNIFILDNGQVRLLDFGFAKFTRMRAVTRAGMAAGSPSYIAPEIWQERSPLDQRIDVYSLGAIVFRALAGSPPFVAQSLSELLLLVTSSPRPSLYQLRPDLPAKVDGWVEHALAISPRDRFSSVRALYNAFASLAQI